MSKRKKRHRRGCADAGKLCVSAMLIAIVTVGFALILTEKKGNTPNARDRDYDINDPCYKRSRTAGYPSNEVEGEESDKTPVKAADYRYDQRDFVYNH